MDELKICDSTYKDANYHTFHNIALNDMSVYNELMQVYNNSILDINNTDNVENMIGEEVIFPKYMYDNIKDMDYGTYTRFLNLLLKGSSLYDIVDVDNESVIVYSDKISNYVYLKV